MTNRSAPLRRTMPYIWAGWLPPFLVVDSLCLWSPWFKAHYSYEKICDFNGAKWQAEHGALVLESRERLINDGFAVFVENQNKLVLQSNGIMMSGKPDIIAVRGDQVLVVDCKTGVPRASHRVQLLIYMVMLPCARLHLRDHNIIGMLQYTHDSVIVPVSEADSEFRARLRSLIHVIGGNVEPPRQASPTECRYCTISQHDCSDRVDTAEDEAVSGHDLF